MNALVIGYGSIGARHAKIIYQMDKFEDLTVLSSQKDLPYKTITKLNEIINLNPDYIVIASSTSLHFKHLKFLEENFSSKSILVEKPLFNKMNKLEINNNNVFIGYNLRFHPIIKKIKEMCKGRELWTINIFCGSYLPDWRPGRDYRKTSSAKKYSGGGVALDLSHELDYTQWFCGNISPLHVLNGKISNLEIDSDDYLMFTGLSSGGAKINIGLNYFTRKPVRKIIIDGKSVSIQADLIANKMHISLDDDINDLSFEEFDRDFTYSAQHRAIINGNYLDICSYSEGLKTMKLIDFIKSNSS